MRYLLLILLLSGCTTGKEYVVKISMMDPETKATTEKVVNIKAADDTSAFKRGCSEYWLQKAVALETNKTFEGTAGYHPSAIPFFFSVTSKNGMVVNYPKEQAERLTYQTVNHYITKVIPSIDTIIPIAKRPKKEAAKIY